MPSLDLRTKKLRYSKADQDALSRASTLLLAMCAYDTKVEKAAGDARDAVSLLLQYVEQQRNGKG